MGSNNGSSEIVELEKSTSFRDSRRFDQAKMGDKDRKHQYLKDDINKLFAAIDIRSSRSLDLSDRFSTDLYQKNAEKKPMRGTSGSQSPGIGFSDPVSLKQALRRQSISHASEMAAMKRGSRPPSSPSLSESRKISSFSASHSAHSSPRFLLMSTFKNVDPTLNRNEIVLSLNKVKNQSLPPQVVPSRSYQEPKIKEVPVKSEENKILPSHLLATKKETKKQSKKKGISVKKKGRLQTLQSSKSPIKRTPRTKLIKKKEIHESPLTDSTSETICQRCQCHLSDSKSAVSNGRDSGSVISVKFNNKSSKSHEQKGFSQSSDSSTGEQSSSKSTVSEESNLSRSSITIRPHMSKNLNWEAIKNVKKKHGFLELGHFSLLKKLGSGDIGTVYLADLIGTNSLFAIKVMDNDFLVRRRKMARAQTESEILRMLDHPFLPTLYAKFTSDNLLCLVMEFCPGGDLHVLRQKQRGRCFPEQAARFYVAEVLLALEYLHMLGIVYRDLKPENIMVREDGHIMLTDFDLSLRCSVNPTLVKTPPGIEPPRMSGPCAGSNCIDPFCASPSCKVSCFLSTTNRARKHRADVASHARTLPQLVAEPTEARSNSFVGTHEYLAPEIIKGEVHGSSVDWWTLGVFLYELLYGKTPFKGAGNEETLANVVMHGLKFPDSPIVSCQARDLIKGLLVKEPENRFGTETGAAEIKRHPFFEGLNWALIRCAVPPQVPEYSEIGVPKMAFQEKGEKYLEYSVTGEQLEFELF